MHRLSTARRALTEFPESAGPGLEKRTQRRPFRVVVHGLRYFCEKLPGLIQSEMWEVRDHSRHRASELTTLFNDLRRCDLAYTWGGRITMGKFLWTARCLGKKKIVMLWSGSDVLFAKEQYAAGKMDPWIAEKIHWAVSPSLAVEVRSLGLDCEYVQASFVNPVAHPKPLPTKFSVLLYQPSVERAHLYGLDMALEAAKALGHIEFNVIGLQKGEVLHPPPNVKVHNWVNDVTPFLERATVVWRPVRHDAGTSFMVLEALAHGRHVLYTYPLPGCIQVVGSEAACKEIQRLRALHESGLLDLNRNGMEYVAHDCSPEKVRSELLSRWEKVILSPAPATSKNSIVQRPS
jgi:hypothetical protein